MFLRQVIDVSHIIGSFLLIGGDISNRSCAKAMTATSDDLFCNIFIVSVTN